MSDVTSRDIMRAAEITNVATLVRWHRHEGLIPHPEIRTHPNGRGKIAYWPEWVLHRCVRIKQLRKGGKSLAQIREVLGNDWETAGSQPKRRYRFAEASRSIDESAARSNIRREVNQFLFDWMKQLQAAIRKTTTCIIADDVVQKALALFEQGVNPVLVLVGDKAVLTADFAVSIHLAKCQSIDDSFMVIPVWKELSAYLAKLATMPEQPVVSPCARVIRKTNSSSEESKVIVLDSWDFEIEAPRRRPSQRTPRKP